ncbi:MAG: isoprenylcysteine carboxylmethyltransferase family protein [bacterium]
MTLLPTIVFVIVIACWFVFAATFLLRKKPPSAADQKRDPRSIVGVALQALSYGVVWGFRRTSFTPMISAGKAVEILLSIVAVAVAVIAVWVVIAAVKTLGKEWSITARVVEGHKLATMGPYRVVRHPIYTGMLGMLVATGLALSYWPALLVAIVICFIGTVIRIRSEERLLREIFGSEFEVYSRSVPALVPGVY